MQTTLILHLQIRHGDDCSKLFGEFERWAFGGSRQIDRSQLDDQPVFGTR